MKDDLIYHQRHKTRRPAEPGMRADSDTPDDLDQYIADQAIDDPDLPARIDAGVARRQQLRALAGIRKERGYSQAEVANRMKTGQSTVARIESGEYDVRLSTLERYAVAIGARFEWVVATQRDSVGLISDGEQVGH